jgi:hypothetical protein
MLSGSNVWCLNLKLALSKPYNSVPSDSETTIRMFGTLRRLQRLALNGVGWHTLPRDLFHRLVSLQSLQLGNNDLMSLSLNNQSFYGRNSVYLNLIQENTSLSHI